MLSGFALRRYEEFAVAVHRESKTYFKLDDIAAIIVEQLVSGMNVNELVNYLINEFDCSDEDSLSIFDDVEQTISYLLNAIKKSKIGQDNNPVADLSHILETSAIDYCAERLIPYSVTWELTSFCNLKCQHCYCPQPSLGRWNIENVKDTMSKMATMGVFDIEFTGGEFFTHKNANIVLSEAIEHGFVISILTNATLIDNKRARHIASLFPRNVQISVYSINSEIHDKITGVNGSLVKTIKGIKHLIDAGIRPIIACPLTIINKDCVDEITKWASELCLDVKFSLKLSHSENSERSPQSLRLKPNSIRDFTRDARVNPFLRNDIKTLSRVDQNSKLLCQAGYRNFALDGFGNMYPCNSLRMGCGNVLDTDIFQLWKNSQEMTHWRNISINSYNKCSMCEAKFVCSPCPADNFSEFHELANISSQDCRVGWETYLAWKENI